MVKDKPSTSASNGDNESAEEAEENSELSTLMENVRITEGSSNGVPSSSTRPTNTTEQNTSTSTRNRRRRRRNRNTNSHETNNETPEIAEINGQSPSTSTSAPSNAQINGPSNSNSPSTSRQMNGRVSGNSNSPSTTRQINGRAPNNSASPSINCQMNGRVPSHSISPSINRQVNGRVPSAVFHEVNGQASSTAPTIFRQFNGRVPTCGNNCSCNKRENSGDYNEPLLTREALDHIRSIVADMTLPRRRPRNRRLRRRRLELLPVQKFILEAEYRINKYPAESVKKELGKKLGVSLREISMWYQTRRRYGFRHNSNNLNVPHNSSDEYYFESLD